MLLNLLQLFLCLGLSYSLSPLPRTRGATLIDPSINATLTNGLDVPPSPAMCINNTVHPNWGLNLDVFDFDVCQEALQIIASKVENKFYISYDFYSRQVYPYGPGTAAGDEAWPLAQGASVGESRAAPC